MGEARERRLVVSFHDLHPGSRRACERFLGLLADLGVTRTSLLVVPCWHGGRPIDEDQGFVAWLHALADAGHDICLHGFFHRADRVSGGPVQRFMGRIYTNSEGEFYQIDGPTAARRVREGLAILRDRAGLPVVGFTPPAWLLSAAGRQALVEAGLAYTTTFGEVDLLQQDLRLPAPTIVYSCRNAWRRFVSRLWVRFWGWRHRHAPLLRIAAHPGDFADPKVEASFVRQVSRALARGRVALSYRDLVPVPASVAASAR